MKPTPLPAQLEDGQLREPRERLCDIDRRFVMSARRDRHWLNVDFAMPRLCATRWTLRPLVSISRNERRGIYMAAR